jgi:SAM-dependent methyltransferase
MNVRRSLKGVILTLVTKYGGDSRRYWDLRWRLGYDVEKGLQVYREPWETQIAQLMQKHNCESILDIGCGKAWLRNLPGYLGSDLSLEVLKQNGLSCFLVADATQRLPLPSKSFDVSVSCCFLMHQSPEKVLIATSEMKRVTKWLVVLKELTKDELVGDAPLKSHCFLHDYKGLFKDFDGKMVMLQW